MDWVPSRLELDIFDMKAFPSQYCFEGISTFAIRIFFARFFKYWCRILILTDIYIYVFVSILSGYIWYESVPNLSQYCFKDIVAFATTFLNIQLGKTFILLYLFKTRPVHANSSVDQNSWKVKSTSTIFLWKSNLCRPNNSESTIYANYIKVKVKSKLTK